MKIKDISYSINLFKTFRIIKKNTENIRNKKLHNMCVTIICGPGKRRTYFFTTTSQNSVLDNLLKWSCIQDPTCSILLECISGSFFNSVNEKMPLSAILCRKWHERQNMLQWKYQFIISTVLFSWCQIVTKESNIGVNAIRSDNYFKSFIHGSP